MRHITWIVAMFSILHKGIGTKSCDTGICFNWKISNMKLTLQCKVHDSKFQTTIEDPKGLVQAICIPPTTQIHCHATYRNGTITLNRMTNELTFTLSGLINRQLNGNWTCRHGTSKDIAHVEVTVLTYSGDESVAQVARTVFGRQCIDMIICISSLSFLSAFIITLVIMAFTSRFSSKLGDLLWSKVLSRCRLQRKIEYVLRIKKCIFALSTVLFFGIAALYAWIDYVDCSAKWLFVGFGLVFGCLSSLICFNKDELRESLSRQGTELRESLSRQGTELRESLSRQGTENTHDVQGNRSSNEEEYCFLEF